MLDKRVRYNHTPTVRVRYNHTRMVQENIPYAYGTYRTRTVCTIRVRYEIRVRYPTAPLSYSELRTFPLVVVSYKPRVVRLSCTLSWLRPMYIRL